MSDFAARTTAIAGIAKDLGTSAKELLIGVSILLVTGWLVFNSSPPKELGSFKAGPDGFEITARNAVAEAKTTATTTADFTEKVHSDTVALNTKMAELTESLSKPNPDLKSAAESLKQANAVLQQVTTQVDQSSTAAAKSLKQIGQAETQITKASQTAAAAAPTAVTGWYYLGRVPLDRSKWLPSTAYGTLTFTPPAASGQDVLKQIEPGKTQVAATGYKYIRANGTSPGKRVEGKIVATLGPSTPARIIELDATGVDPLDKNALVVWAKVVVD